MKTFKIYGPPGTGKTRYLVDRFAERPEGSVFLTFTRAARAEILSRVPGAEARTIHSACWRALRFHRDQMIRPRDLRRFGRTIGVEMNGGGFGSVDVESEEQESAWVSPTQADFMLQLNHAGRHRRETLKAAMLWAPPEVDYRWAKWFTLSYRAWKTAEDKLDHTDLLDLYLERGAPLDAARVFVDEAQDLSLLQWAVVTRMASRAGELWLAGDDDQAVFAWAGASAAAFAGYPSDKQRVLGQSHRVPRAVHAVARRISSRIKQRVDKPYEPRGEEGEVLAAGAPRRDDLQGSALVLFRNHFRAGELAAALVAEGVPFLGERSPLRPDVLMALAGWRAVWAGEQATREQAWALVSLASSRWLGPDAVKNARSGLCSRSGLLVKSAPPVVSEVLGKMPRVRWVEKMSEHPDLLKPKTRLLSIHQAKGLEADTVLLDTQLARKTWDAHLVDPDDEHRVWYVGATRARERLVVLESADPMSYKL